MTKRISVFARATSAVVVLICALLLAGCGGDYKTDETFLVSQNDKVLRITSYNGNDKDLVIPDSINGKPVVIIGSDAFAGNTTIETVKMPDSVIMIGDRAFEDCSSLTSVDFSTNLESIGYKAFNHCTSLTSITLPERPDTFDGYDEMVKLGFRPASEYLNIQLPTGNSRIDRKIEAGNKELTEVYGTSEWYKIISDRSAEVERIKSAYEAINNPTANDKFLMLKALRAVSGSPNNRFEMSSVNIDNYAPIDDKTLPRIAVDFATEPDGKVMFVTKFNYDGDDFFYDSVNSNDYILDFELLTLFESKLDSQQLEQYQTDDLREVEYLILITHNPASKQTYRFENSSIDYEYIVNSTTVVIDLYRVNTADGTFSKAKNIDSIDSVLAERYDNSVMSETDFYHGPTRAETIETIIAHLSEIK